MVHSATIAKPHHRRHSSRAAAADSGALVMCASIPWHFHRNRQQELAERLSAFMPVIYVEPPHANGARPHRESHSLWAAGRGCYVLPSPRGLPGDRAISLINKLVQRGMARAIQRALSALRSRCTVLWIDRIESVALMDAFPGALAVYDCVDEEWSFGRAGRRAYLERVEKELLGRSDLAIASSNTLRRRLSAWAPRLELVANGCDFQHFSRAAGPMTRPSDLPATDAPVIGFVGGLTRRALDYSLLARLFSRFPACHFVFVGTADAASGRLIARGKNTRLLGAKDYADIPAYMAAFDVAIIPYRVGGRIDYVYPKKLHEYLASGKPVVATDLPELRQFEGVIKIGRTPQEFGEKIEECLEENADAVLSARLAAERKAVARDNTWEKRVEQIVAILDPELRARGFPGLLESRAHHHA